MVVFMIWSIILALSLQVDSAAQTQPYVLMLPEVEVLHLDITNTPFDRFRSKVIKVYPYALMGKLFFEDIQAQNDSLSKRAFKKYKRSEVTQLKEVFKEEIKQLTVSEGKILVQLINRETGGNCYDLIRNLKGGAAAVAWNIVAKRNGYNLKDAYDPDDPENEALEAVVQSLGSLREAYLNGALSTHWVNASRTFPTE